jgi:hypothetical protein
MSADPSQAVVDLGLTGGSPPATPPRRESVARERHDSVLSSGTINKCDASSIVRFQSQYILYNVAQNIVMVWFADAGHVRRRHVTDSGCQPA